LPGGVGVLFGRSGIGLGHVFRIAVVGVEVVVEMTTMTMTMTTMTTMTMMRAGCAGLTVASNEDESPVAERPSS